MSGLVSTGNCFALFIEILAKTDKTSLDRRFSDQSL
jgi:hypothetical protein